jgi:hypothetical protein
MASDLLVLGILMETSPASLVADGAVSNLSVVSNSSVNQFINNQVKRKISWIYAVSLGQVVVDFVNLHKSLHIDHN